MAINFETTDPAQLLASYKEAIREKKVLTWAVDDDGDFYHTPDQWKNRGWLRPDISLGRLTMNFVCNKGFVTRPADYGVLHGRFIESMLTHCDRLFTTASATAMPTNSDIINTTATASA
jgi:hypothetical protein